MIQSLQSLMAVISADIDVNLWGALGCSVAFSAALFAVLDALGDFALSQSSRVTKWESTGHRLRFGSKLAASGITAVSAGVVLALDNNWWALAGLATVFVIVIVWALLAINRTRTEISAPIAE